MKRCTGECSLEKDESCFGFSNKKKGTLKSKCKKCTAKYQKQYEQDHKEERKKSQRNWEATHKEERKKYYNSRKEIVSEYGKQYRKEHQEEISQAKKQYRLENKEKIKKYTKEYTENHKKEKKQYYKTHEPEIKKYKKEYKKNRIKNDPVFKLRNNTSRSVNLGLKNREVNKNGHSFYKLIGYTPQELMDHLMNHPEKESWMNENNQGIYNPESWDDNNSSTWVWNIDHIIPHSEFHYISMEDDNFKKCWALSNLRPLSAKQNIIDGSTRIRHKRANNG